MTPKQYEIVVNKAVKENVNAEDYSDLLEVIGAELFEIHIDPLDTHEYNQTSQYTWDFIDRVGNHMRVLILPEKNDIKSAFVIKDGEKEILVYDKDKLPEEYREKIVDLPDERRINTIYKIITKEILPTYLLDKKPSKLSFTPISKTRERLTQVVLSKIAREYPYLEKRGKYLVNK